MRLERRSLMTKRTGGAPAGQPEGVASSARPAAGLHSLRVAPAQQGCSFGAACTSAQVHTSHSVAARARLLQVGSLQVVDLLTDLLSGTHTHKLQRSAARRAPASPGRAAWL